MAQIHRQRSPLYGSGIAFIGVRQRIPAISAGEGLDDRIEETVGAIAAPEDDSEDELPLSITSLSDVQGVNALVPGSIIEPHDGLTILYGENGTGKTGYSRVFKALAGGRTAFEVLGDITVPTPTEQSAKVKYKLGEESDEITWRGETGLSPFTRSSIFDSPAVNFHVDDDLEYVYVPAVLALYNHVSAAINGVQERVDERLHTLAGSSAVLLERFPRGSSIYSAMETLGATTDLEVLSSKTNREPDAPKTVEVLEGEVAALGANTVGATIKVREREDRVLGQAISIIAAITTFDLDGFNGRLAKRSDLQRDHAAFRRELFKSADLPIDPDDTWEKFVASGENYRLHLEESGVHDAGRCLYCRQDLGTPAAELIGRYGEFLADKISSEIRLVSLAIDEDSRSFSSVVTAEVESFVNEFLERDDQPPYIGDLQQVVGRISTLRNTTSTQSPAELPDPGLVGSFTSIEEAANVITADLSSLRVQDRNRTTVLTEKQTELSELKASIELARSWTQVEGRVESAKETDRLQLLVKPFRSLKANATELAKAASDQLMNQSFDALFQEECAALNAPPLKLQFVGKQGKAQRRKLLAGDYKPSKVLSEGEQKVLAIADFLAEARLAGISAPVIFDDPVSSLDHRRINEVAERIATLAQETQVIVFTHDILFATKLLSLFEKSKQCTYYLVSDEQGKGHVSKATGQSWESLKNYKGKINKAIQDAGAAEGETRVALVRLGYSSIRSWCEIFVERELLEGVAERYQPNVRIGALPNIKAGALAEAIPIVTRIFNEACRHIPGHSHPLVTQGVSPTLENLQAHWAELEKCQKTFRSAERTS